MTTLFKLFEFVWPIVWFDCLVGGGIYALKNLIYLVLVGDNVLEVGIVTFWSEFVKLDDWKSLTEDVP